MKKQEEHNQRENISDTDKEHISFPVVGKIADSPYPGSIYVAFDDMGAVPARLLKSVDRKALSGKSAIGQEVLLMFEKGNRNHPIIVGQLENIVDDMISLEVSRKENDPVTPLDVQLDNERISLEAKNEIVLRCGKGSITIRKDGKIVILGTNLISRSRGRNKIKGASVSIN